MRLFKATAKNHMHWVSDGALDAEFYVLATDFVSALVKADETLDELRAKLGINRSVDGLRIRHLSEVGEVVGDVIMEREPQTEGWVERTVRKIKEQER